MAYFALVTITLYAGRIPSMLYGEAINPDEAQMLAQALTLTHHPIPWRDYDPTTSGPLNSAILDIPKLLGTEPTYFTSRLIAATLLVVLLFAVYDIIRRSYGELVGRLATLPAIMFFSLNTFGDFTDYASEILSISLIAIATDLGLSATLGKEKPLPRRLFLCGLILGALPLAKLQSVPFATLIFFVVLLLIWRTRTTPALKAKSSWSFATGLFLVPLILFATLAAAGAMHDFVMSYLVAPSFYVKQYCCRFLGPNDFVIEKLLLIFLQTCCSLAGLGLLATLIATVIATAKHLPTKRLDPASWLIPVFFLTMLLTAIYSIEQTQRAYPHYLLLLIVPASGLTASLGGLALLSWRRIVPTRPHLVVELLAVSVLAAIVVLPTLVVRLTLGNEFVEMSYVNFNTPPPEVYAALKERVLPDERMAIWGWMPEYLVATRSVMGTRDSITEFAIEGASLAPYYRERYLSDMKRNNPKYFLDSVAPVSFLYHDRAGQGLESFPELQSLISKNYHLVMDVDGIRLFQRNS